MVEKTKLPAKTEEKSNLPAVAKEDYLVLSASPEEIETAVAATKGRRIRIFDLERASLPSGKGKPEWIITGGPEGEEFRPEMTGVIIGASDKRTWWRAAYGEGNKGPPDCSSDDAITGYGDRSLEDGGDSGTHDCMTCEWAKFGSSRKGGTGQDCAERRVLFLLIAESIYPMIFILPPTSIKAIDSYRMAMGGRMKPLYTYEVTLGIEKATSNDGVDFSRIVLKRNRIMSGPQLERLKQISSSFQATMSSTVARDIEGDMVEN